MDNPGNIVLEVTDQIGIIKIGPPPGNFLVKPEFIPLETLKDWIASNQLKGILISGMGKHFSGGAKLEELFKMAENTDNLKAEMNLGRSLLNYIETLTIPVIAAIQGTCFGGGLEIALACHMRICSENSLFAFPEINHDLMPGLGGIGSTMEKTSFFKSMSFILSGDMINAEEALSMKIVDKIVPASELFSHSFNLLKKMTTGRELKVIRFIMKALHNTRLLSREESVREESRMFCELAKDEADRRKTMSNG